MIKAEVGTLLDDAEIREVCQRVVQCGAETPLGNEQDLLDGIDLYLFFKTAIENGVDFLGKGCPPRYFIKEYQAKINS